MSSRIIYNSKTIIFPRPPEELQTQVILPKVINTSITGDTEHIIRPRVDVLVQAKFFIDANASLRAQLESFWRWAQAGNAFTFALSSDKTVNATLSGSEAAGQTVLSLTSTSGVVAGQFYVLKSGPYYQAVRVTAVNTSVSPLVNDVTIDSALDYTFPAGTRFRSWHFFSGVIRDSNARSPFRDRPAGLPHGTNGPDHFDFNLEFYEIA